MSSADVGMAAGSVVAGAAGTATMTFAYPPSAGCGELCGPARLRRLSGAGQIVASVMHLPHVTDREDRELGLALRWSYGSAFGLLARRAAAASASRGRRRVRRRR